MRVHTCRSCGSCAQPCWPILYDSIQILSVPTFTYVHLAITATVHDIFLLLSICLHALVHYSKSQVVFVFQYQLIFQPTCIVERQIVCASAEHLAGGGVLDEAGGAVSTSNHVCP